jgi:predicted nucleic acid-binding protein
VLVIDASVAVAASHSPIGLAPPGLARTAWEVADEFGWAKTYDAHYVALARLRDCRLVTIDERLLRGIARLGIAVRPREI